MSFFADVPSEKVQYGKRTDLCNFVNSTMNKTFHDQLLDWKQYATKNGVYVADYALANFQNTTVDMNKNMR
jgi:hypothetical protein